MELLDGVEKKITKGRKKDEEEYGGNSQKYGKKG